MHHNFKGIKKIMEVNNRKFKYSYQSQHRLKLTPNLMIPHKHRDIFINN